MVFHYQRTPVDGGGVSKERGQPPGRRLSAVLEGGLPPLRVALEIAAACCEMIYIAEEDEDVHGDIGVEHAWITGDGVLSIAGFGEERTSTRAPEQRVRGSRTDRYGLGRLCAAVLMPGSEALDHLPTHSLKAHNDQALDFVMEADLGDLADNVQNAARYFVLHLMAFDRVDRPEPLSAWRSLIAFARTEDGPTLEEWTAEVFRGGGARRAARMSREERLAPPRAMAGPLSRPVKTGFSKHRSKTTYWESSDEPGPISRTPSVPEQGGGQKTGHFSRVELAAMARGLATAPRPKRSTPTEDMPETVGSISPPPAVPGGVTSLGNARRARRHGETGGTEARRAVSDNAERRRVANHDDVSPDVGRVPRPDVVRMRSQHGEGGYQVPITKVAPVSSRPIVDEPSTDLAEVPPWLFAVGVGLALFVLMVTVTIALLLVYLSWSGEG